MLGLNPAEHGSGPDHGLTPLPQRVGPPVLASQVLREELAPIEPEGRSARIWFAGIASSFFFLGVALSSGIGAFVPGSAVAFVALLAALALFTTAIIPLPYRLRAAAASATGILLMLLGMRDIGPLAGLSADEGGVRTLTRLMAITAVPAALLFRSHYRAYRKARVMLAVALLLALPFMVSEIALALDTASPWLSRIVALIDALVLAAAAVGFMGDGTTAGASKGAALTLLVLSAGVAAHEFVDTTAVTSGPLAYTATAIALLGAATVTSIGFYQLLAAYFANDARRVVREAEPKLSDPPDLEESSRDALSESDEGPSSLE